MTIKLPELSGLRRGQTREDVKALFRLVYYRRVGGGGLRSPGPVGLSRSGVPVRKCLPLDRLVVLRGRFDVPRPTTYSLGVRNLARGGMLAILVFGLACGQPTRLPSIVLITIDTLRADHLGCYGYFRDTSPTIDQLAREGILFERVVTSMSTTLPAHTSLFTSSYPARNGVLANYNVWAQPAPTGPGGLRSVAQLLEAEGYRTAAYVSVFHLGRGSGLGAGFQVHDGVVTDLSGKGGVWDRRADVTTDRTLGWLGGAGKEPFFLWVHYFDPHDPYDPPPPYDLLYSTDSELVRWIERKRIPARLQEKSAQDHNDYDGEIRFTDTQIERLFAGLKRLGLYDESLIILTADHGEGLMQHGHREHGVLYNEQLFVPLIMKFPKDRGPAGQRIDRLTSVIDVFPTALAAIDLQFDAGFDGVDVLTEERAYALSEREHAENRFGTDINYTLTGLEWKYFYHTEKPDVLFHLTDDLDENRDVIDEYPDVAKALREETLRLVHEHQQRGEGLEIKREVSPELLDALRGLGYVQ